MNSMPRGDLNDIVTSSRRDGLENVTLTAASVTEDPESRVLRSDELHTNAFDLGERTGMSEQLNERGATAK
jgi:hypothetical protein